MRSSEGATDRKLAGKAAQLLRRPGRAGRIPRQGRLVELARETSRRLRRGGSPRAA